HQSTSIRTSLVFSPRLYCFFFFFFSSRRRHTRSKRDWSSDVCSSDLLPTAKPTAPSTKPTPRFQRSRSSSAPLSTRPLKSKSASDRKSTRLNSSHVSISYAVFCLKKKIMVYVYCFLLSYNELSFHSL